MYNRCKQVSTFFSTISKKISKENDENEAAGCLSINIGEANLSTNYVGRQTSNPKGLYTVLAAKQLFLSANKLPAYQPFMPEEAAYQPSACQIF
jgi:hypothetical protein